MEAIILAGGMGTRLKSVVSDVPKCMAPVAGNPFLYYILSTLEKAGFSRIILSLGYKYEIIEEWIKTYPTQMVISSVIEETPLGTGGGVKLALSQATEKEVFVLNGDTFFNIDYSQMLDIHSQTKALATLALKEMKDFTRYGVVEIDKLSNSIIGFLEKQYRESGLINGGIYLINSNALDEQPEKFSIEKDFFEVNVLAGNLTGFPANGYFIDIGIPQDYAQAQSDFANDSYKSL